MSWLFGQSTRVENEIDGEEGRPSGRTIDATERKTGEFLANHLALEQ